MSRLSFRDYVKTHSPEDSPAGDFIMDAQHPAAAKIPDVKTWDELEKWLEEQGAASGFIDSAELLWQRYLAVRDAVHVELGNGLTVAQLIELLKRENPTAHVIKFHPAEDVTATRVRGFSRVTITQGKERRELSAIMLE